MQLEKMINNNLVENWEDDEYVYDYLGKIQNKYNINIWFYRPSTDDKRSTTINNSKEELLDKCSDLVRDRKKVRILVWDEHCALIKNIVLLERRSIGFVILYLLVTHTTKK